MNGSLINSNFVVGMLLAKDLPRSDQILSGLTAGQMGPSGAVGIVGLKRLVDERTEAERGRSQLEIRATNAEKVVGDLEARARTAEAERDGLKQRLELLNGNRAIIEARMIENLDALFPPRSTSSGSGTPTASTPQVSAGSPIPQVGSITTTPQAGATTTPQAGATAGASQAGSTAAQVGTAPATQVSGTAPSTQTIPTSQAQGTAAAATAPASPATAGTPTLRIIADRRKYTPKELAAYKRARKPERRQVCAVLSA